MNTSRVILPWTTAGLAFLSSGLLVMSSRTAAMNVMDAFFLVPALLFAVAANRERLGAWPNEYRIMALFLAYAALSTLYSDSPNVSRFFRGAVEVGILFAFFRVLALEYEPLFWRALFWACAVTAGVCLFALVLYYGVAGHPFSSALYALPAPGPLNMDLNQLYAGMLVISLPFLMNQARKQLPASDALRWICHAATTVFLVYLIANQRRSALVALAAGCAVLLASRFSRRSLLAILGVAVLVLASTLVNPELIISRGLSYRLEIWTESLHPIRQQPIFGHGLSSAPHAITVVTESGVTRHFSHPHNYFLSMLYHLGIVGLVLWTLAWIGPWLRRLFAAPVRQRQPFLLAALGAGLTAVMFDGSIYPLSPFQYNWGSVWIPMAILLATVARPANAAGPALSASVGKRSRDEVTAAARAEN